MDFLMVEMMDREHAYRVVVVYVQRLALKKTETTSEHVAKRKVAKTADEGGTSMAYLRVEVM
mgnify:CR=1 FL=1